MSERVEHLAEGVTLHLGDCRDILPTLGPVDAVVTDPPYGLGEKWQGGCGTKRKSWVFNPGEARAWDGDTSDALPMALSVAAHAIIWGGNYYPLEPQRGWLIWDKIVRNFTTGHVELAWTTLDQPTRAFNYAHAQLASEGKFHPTQKPLPLMQWCLGFLPDAKVILDPFMGSGTTGVAAVKMGKGFIGVEREQSYFDIACKRIERALKQPDMFTPMPPKMVQETML